MDTYGPVDLVGTYNFTVEVSSQKISKKCTVDYFVRVDSDGQYGLQQAYYQTPPLGAVLAIDNLMELTGKTVKQGETPYDFIVTCTFSYEAEQAQGNPNSGVPPLARDPIYNFSSELVDWEIYKDIKGKDIANTVGQPFDPPVTISRPRINLTIQKNLAVPQFNPMRFVAFVSCVNSRTFVGFPKGSVMFMEFNGGEIKYEMKQYYVPCTFSFKIDPALWNPIKIANIGTMCKKDGKLVPVAQDGFVTSDRVFLDKNGNRTDKVEFLEFDIYKYADFNTMF